MTKNVTQTTTNDMTTSELTRYIGGGAATDALEAVQDDLETIEMAIRYHASAHEDEDIARIARSLAMVSFRLQDTIVKMSEKAVTS